MNTFLDMVKTALRITTTAFDDELQLLIDACILELKSFGVTNIETENGIDPQVQTAVIAYVKWLHGNNADKEQWEKIYHTKLAQFQTMSGHRDWSGING